MAFEPGDKVRHAQCPSWRGVVVRVGRAEGQGARRIYWKGHDPFNPDRVDWTWDFAMEHDDGQI